MKLVIVLSDQFVCAYALDQTKVISRCDCRFDELWKDELSIFIQSVAPAQCLILIDKESEEFINKAIPTMPKRQIKHFNANLIKSTFGLNGYGCVRHVNSAIGHSQIILSGLAQCDELDSVIGLCHQMNLALSGVYSSAYISTWAVHKKTESCHYKLNCFSTDGLIWRISFVVSNDVLINRSIAISASNFQKQFDDELLKTIDYCIDQGFFSSSAELTVYILCSSNDIKHKNTTLVDVKEIVHLNPSVHGYEFIAINSERHDLAYVNMGKPSDTKVYRDLVNTGHISKLFIVTVLLATVLSIFFVDSLKQLYHHNSDQRSNLKVNHEQISSNTAKVDEFPLSKDSLIEVISAFDGLKRDEEFSWLIVLTAKLLSTYSCLNLNHYYWNKTLNQGEADYLYHTAVRGELKHIESSHAGFSVNADSCNDRGISQKIIQFMKEKQVMLQDRSLGSQSDLKQGSLSSYQSEHFIADQRYILYR